RFFYLTTKAKQPYWDVKFRAKDFLVFGRETKGLPERVLNENRESCITIPMHGTRSLNLSTAVAIVLFEAMRQVRAGLA
ncbi:MAG: tRNA (cytidine(34)-2'-O)-methyltransferase, partial [Verrucomicrobia bacterium]